MLLALRARDKTGRGQMIDIGLYEPIFRILDELAPAYALNGQVRQRMGPGTVNVCPHSHYPTKDDRWVAIACTNDKIFARLAVLMGAPELTEDDHWGRTAGRLAAREQVDEYVAAWTSRHDRVDVLALCEQAQVPCGPVYGIDEIFEDPQYAHRGNILRMPDNHGGEVAIPNLVPRLSDTPGSVNWLGPKLGEHNDAVFQTMLGLSAPEIARLEAEGVI